MMGAKACSVDWHTKSTHFRRKNENQKFVYCYKPNKKKKKNKKKGIQKYR
jgi:hypothetical protein